MAECDAAVETESVEDDDIMSEISETPTLDTDIIDELYGEARETIQQQKVAPKKKKTKAKLRVIGKKSPTKPKKKNKPKPIWNDSINDRAMDETSTKFK